MLANVYACLRVCLYCDRVVIACVSCHVCMVVVGVYVVVCMRVCLYRGCVVIACMGVVLCVSVSLAMFVL